jgi:predicted ester cyclase
MKRSCGIVGLGLTMMVSACGGSQPPAPAAAPPAPVAKTADERVKMYLDCWQQFNDKQWDRFQDCYAEDAASDIVDSGRPVIQGRAAIIANNKQEVPAFPDRRGELKLVLANGAHLAGVALWTGTHDGDLPGPDGKAIPATHKKFGLYLVHTGELDPTGARIVSDAVYSDDATLMAQLGLSKAPARKALAPSGAAPTVVIARNDDTERKNMAAFQTMIDLVNKHDLKAFADGLADDYKLIDVTMPADLAKKPAVASLAQYIKAFPDMTLTADSTWAAGDYVAAAGTFTGTNKGTMPEMGITKPTGKAVKVRFFEIVKFENGKAKEDWQFFNGAAFGSQLGMK